MAGKPKYFRQPYSEEQVSKIVTAVSLTVGEAKRDYLHKELNKAAKYYLYIRDDPTPAQLRNHLAAIEKAAERLISALRTGKYKSQSTTAEILSEMPIRVLSRLVDSVESDFKKKFQPTIDGYDRVKETILSVSSLRHWASSAEIEVNKEVKPHGKTPDIESIFFAGALAEIYRKTFDRKPGVSRGSNQPGGPFFRFVDTCLTEIGDKRSPESIAELAKRGKTWASEITRQLESKKDN